jgi:hypothetical protein
LGSNVRIEKAWEFGRFHLCEASLRPMTAHSVASFRSLRTAAADEAALRHVSELANVLWKALT